MPNSNFEFLHAIANGQQSRARACLSKVDWKAFDFRKVSPLISVFSPDPWKDMTESEFLTRNLQRISNRAYENFDFGESYTCVDSGGWESRSTRGGSVEFTRAVYLERSEGGESEWEVEESEDESSTRATMTIRFLPGSSEIDEVYVIDASGNVFGRLSGADDLHKREVIGCRSGDMPDFLDQVIGWCVEAGRVDLLDGHANRQHAAADKSPVRLHTIYQCARIGLGRLVVRALEAGANPCREVSEGGRVLDAIEADFGEEMVNVVRAHLAKAAALDAMGSLEQRTVAP